MITLKEFNPPIAVEPGIQLLGYYFYREAIIWCEDRLRYSWQERDPLRAKVRDHLIFLREKANYFSRSRGGRDFTDKHQVILWEMHGHRIYAFYTDGSVILGLEVDERHW